MLRVAPGLLRLGAIAAALAGLSLAQRVLPASAPAVTAPAPEPQRAGFRPGPAAVYAAVGLPGLEKVAREIPLDWRPLQIDPEFVFALMGDFQWQPGNLPFVAPPEAGRVRPLVLNGHGDFHHVTYFVLEALIEPMGEPYTVVSFDAHDDLRGARGIEGADAQVMANRIDMGNWGRWALARLPNLKRIVQPGTVDNGHCDLSPWLDGAVHEGRAEVLPAEPGWAYYSAPGALGRGVKARPDLLSRLTGKPGVLAWNPGWNHRPEALLERIGTRAVYVTVDLDLLNEKDFDDLKWGTGKTSLDEVLEAIDAIAAHHVVLGADVTGFPPSRRLTSAWSYEKCLAAYRVVSQVLYESLGGTWPADDAGVPAEPGAAADAGAPSAASGEAR